jgi:hypothetical protein
LRRQKEMLEKGAQANDKKLRGVKWEMGFKK